MRSRSLVFKITILLLFLSSCCILMAATSVNLSQCGNLASGAPTNCAWQNGNLNANQAHWQEGDSVPYQVVISGLTPGNSYTLTIGYGTTKGGKHAIDYLTNYDRTMAGGTPSMVPTNGIADECLGVTNCSGPANTFAIPHDSNLGTVNQIAGNFAAFNGTITAVGSYQLSGSYSSDSQTNVAITFTAGPANVSSTTTVVLAWAGHIATRADWGQTNGAVNITGSPFHTSLVSFSGGSVGSQDRGLTASAINFPATIIISKTAIPTSNTSFPFTITPALTGTTSFNLVGNGTSSNTVTYTINTSSGFNVAYAFAESASPGWSLTNLNCTTDPISGSTATTSGATATITPQEAGVITCTYTNSEPPAATPAFTPAPGTYTSAQSVTLSSSTGTSIRYTTDLSTPTETAGTLYSGPIPVNATTTIKAIA
jgi:hypothetical protein